jgi:hypothetical protein
MTLPRHPLLRVLLALWGLLFMVGMLFVGLVVSAGLLLWAKLRGRSVTVPFGLGRRADAPWAGFQASPPKTQTDVIEGQARRVE